MKRYTRFIPFVSLIFRTALLSLQNEQHRMYDKIVLER